MTCRDCIHYFVCSVSGGEIYETEEQLKADCPHYIASNENVAPIADTVRKMQERLMEKILENTVGNDSFAYFLKGYIDQVAKEMEEDKG